MIRIAATGLMTGEGIRVLIGQWDADVASQAPLSGRPGAWQVEARVPDVAGVSQSMPVVIVSAGRISNAVTVSIR